MVHLNVFWTRPQSYYDQGGGWRGTWKLDGGAFMNQASHYVDLMEWLIGPVAEVQAMIATHRKIEAEDTGVMNLRFHS
jgi:UDP-N-acetyl-2-amino-2-deoxyglucuronate dehydrogenase